MKAYYLYVYYDDDAGGEIVFANNYKEALRGWGIDIECDYIDRRCRRAPEFDGMENASEYEMALKKWREGWRFNSFHRVPDSDYDIPDEVFKKWYELEYADTESVEK